MKKSKITSYVGLIVLILALTVFGAACWFLIFNIREIVNQKYHHIDQTRQSTRIVICNDNGMVNITKDDGDNQTLIVNDVPNNTEVSIIVDRYGYVYVLPEEKK